VSKKLLQKNEYVLLILEELKMSFQPFFPPSSDITRKLMRRIGERRANTIRAFAQQPDPESEGSDELLTSILDALETDPESTAEADWEDQRWLSEVVYNFLGLRMGRIRRGAETDEITRSDLVEGMSHGLGLHRDEDRELLEQLADEFSSWLSDQSGVYVAAWGLIVLERYEGDTIRLKPLMKHRTDTVKDMIEVVDRGASVAQGDISAKLDY
jgi:hypothetical protein